MKNSIFKYKYDTRIIEVIEFLRSNEIKYIEISPIIPDNSEMWLPLKKEFNNKGIYSIANFDLDFNIVNEILIKNGFKNCFTALKGIDENEECDFIFIQCMNIKQVCKKAIINYLEINKYEYKVKEYEENMKAVIKIF